MTRIPIRRWRIALTAVVAACTLFTSACSTNDPAQSPLIDHLAKGTVGEYQLLEGKPYDGTKIRFLTCCTTVPQFAALNQRTADFTRRTGISVEWSNIPYAAFLQKIVAESAIGGGTYDALIWPDAWGPSLRIGVQPLDAALAAQGMNLDDFPKPFVEAARTGTDRVYGMPIRGFSYNYFYRKDVYAQLGLQPPRTWAEFDSQMALIKQKTGLNPIAGQYARKNGQNLNTWLTMLWSNGGEVFTPDGKAAFTSPQAIAATKAYLSALTDGFSPPASTNWAELESTTDFLKGRAAGVFTWSWHQEEFDNPAKAAPELKGNVGVAAMPAFEGKQSSSYAYTWLAGVLNTSNHQGAAWEYVKWLSSARLEREIALDKSNPKTSTGITMHTSTMLAPDVNAANGGLPRIQYEALQTARAVPMTMNWPRVMDILSVAINQAATGADVDATMAEAARKVDQLH